MKSFLPIPLFSWAGCGSHFGLHFDWEWEGVYTEDRGGSWDSWRAENVSQNFSGTPRHEGTPSPGIAQFIVLCGTGKELDANGGYVWLGHLSLGLP